MRPVVISLAAPVAVVLAACGGSSSESTTQASADASAGASAAASVVAGASATASAGADATTGATPAPAGSDMPGASPTSAPREDLDACALVPAEEVQSIIGYPATGQALNSGSEAYGIDACTWGGPDQGTFMSLQVFTPGQVGDPIGVLLGASGATAQPADSLPNGAQWPLGALPGGGGEGVTYTFTTGGKQGALSLLGSNTTAQQQQALLAAAQKVAGQLGS